MKELSNRTATFTDSVIRRMTRISNKYGAVNLSQGFPDFDPPAQLLDSLSTIATDPKPLYHQYSITWGAQNFREALAAKQTRYMGRTIDPNSEIVVTCGSTEAMMTAMMTVTNPGDKVVIFSPFYENYGADTILTGAEPIYVPLTPPEFTFDPEELENAFRQHPKALILCNPSNPCGKVFTRAELELIADMAETYDTYVITDEVYEHIVYAPYQHTYFATLPGMWQRTISCSSLSKTYSITGWRLGYACGPAPIIKIMTKIHQSAIMSAPTTSQYAAITALRECDGEIDKMRDEYNMRRRLVVHGFNSMGLTCFEPRGAFYAFPCIKSTGMTSQEFCTKLLEQKHVALVPGDAFGASGEGYCRVSYAYSVEHLTEAMKRIREFLKENGINSGEQ